MAPTNFKTYESQARLLAAVIASAPDLKLNFKGIVCLFIRSNEEQNLYLLHTFSYPHLNPHTTVHHFLDQSFF